MKGMSFDSRVFLAPMAGITDLPMRRIVADLGPGNLVSEMAAVNAISRKNPKSYRIADVRSEPYPVVVQLVGNDPALFADAARLAEELGACSVDINMGCPVKKIVANRSGAYLMTDLPRAAAIVKSVRAAVTLPVSVKFRKGWDHQSINAVEFGQLCEDCGAAYVTVHGRTRSDFYAGKADWDIIAAVKQALKIPVVGNGDVTSPQEAARMLAYTKADAVMIGRAALGNPWLISQTHRYLEEGKPAEVISPREVKETLLKHIKELIDYYGEKTALPLSRKYVCWYSKSLRDAKKFRERYLRLNDFATAIAEIHQYFDHCEEGGEK